MALYNYIPPGPQAKNQEQQKKKKQIGKKRKDRETKGNKLKVKK